jgi:peptide-methionine (S)-S-oxide reductase
MSTLLKFGFGGGCHWCTEAVFKQLKGVHKVLQGYIASTSPFSNFSEAVIVSFNPSEISLKDLIMVHLNTHASTKDHSFRDKYRSAVYYYSLNDKPYIKRLLEDLKREDNKAYITKILKLESFKESRESIRDYYTKHPNAPFCNRYILPKFKILKNNYSSLTFKGFDLEIDI